MDKDDNKERRCKSCHKLLIDEKLPICRRCRLKGRDNAVKAVGVGVTASIGVFGVVAKVAHSDNSA